MMKGFTLVETLVAVTILTVAVVGPFTALQGALKNSFAARDQLVAASLAQEGVEYIRSVRDNNYLAGNPWLAGLAACQPGPCVVDPTQGTASGTVAPLRISSNSLYTQVVSGNTLTRFTRTVQIATLSANEVRVTVTVSWNTGGVPYTMQIVENLRDWL